jgi:hypothetical protein
MRGADGSCGWLPLARRYSRAGAALVEQQIERRGLVENRLEHVEKYVVKEI